MNESVNDLSKLSLVHARLDSFTNSFIGANDISRDSRQDASHMCRVVGARLIAIGPGCQLVQRVFGSHGVSVLGWYYFSVRKLSVEILLCQGRPFLDNICRNLIRTNLSGNGQDSRVLWLKKMKHLVEEHDSFRWEDVGPTDSRIRTQQDCFANSEIITGFNMILSFVLASC